MSSDEECNAKQDQRVNRDYRFPDLVGTMTGPRLFVDGDTGT